MKYSLRAPVAGCVPKVCDRPLAGQRGAALPCRKYWGFRRAGAARSIGFMPAFPVASHSVSMQPVPPVVHHLPARKQARLACMRAGSGPALIQVGAWMGHLQHDADAPMAGPLMRALARGHEVLRYDPLGCGLSDRLQPGTCFEDWLQDLEVVAATVAAPRFALLGISQGAAVALAYAARHPQRVSRLVLHGAYARGPLVRDASPASVQEAEIRASLAAIGWGRADAAFRQVFTTQLIPAASRAQQAQFNELQRLAASPETAAAWMRTVDRIDIAHLLPLVSCPVLVLHSSQDRRVPLEAGRLLASDLPDAEFVSVPSSNHLLLDTEPAWPRWLEHVQEFLARDDSQRRHEQLLTLFTERQRSLIELMAQGRHNGQIAARLGLSERTVRNQLTHIFDKLQVEGRSQAIVRLRESGFGAASG
jgi:pimeloyl-ACP methyl ester carboxylesterase/DNA-binding CsgD family transcriptional regulator